MTPADPVARPAIDPASAPVPPPDPSARPELRRFTMDLPTDTHRALRLWSLEARVPASTLVMALVEAALISPPTRERAEVAALALRRGSFQRPPGVQ